MRQTLYKRQFEQIVDRKVVEYDMKMKEKQDNSSNNRVSESRRKRRALEDKERQMRITISKDQVSFHPSHLPTDPYPATRKRRLPLVHESAGAPMAAEARIR